MVTRNSVQPKTNRKSGKVKKKERGLEFCMIPLNDLKWVLTQKPSTQQLFLECWTADPYGSRWMQLSTKLKRAAFMAAKKQLSDQGLFIFKPEPSIQDGRSTVCWLVRNLHGSRVKDFWKESTQMDSESTQMDSESTQMDLESTQMDLESTQMDSILPQTQSYQGFPEASTSPQHRLNNTSTTPQRVVEVCCEADLANSEKDSLRSTACVGGTLHTPLPPPPQSGMVAQSPQRQGCASPSVSASAPTPALDVEAPTALSEDSQEGEGERMDLPATSGTVTPSAQPLVTNGIETSAQPLATLADQAEAAGEELEDLGQDKCSGGSAAEISKLVDQICEFAIAHGCPVQEAEKEEMMNNFTLKKLEVTLDHLQRQMSQYSTHTKKQRFRFALGMGRWSRDN